MSLSPYTVVVFSQDTGNVVPFASVEIKVRNPDGSSGSYAAIYTNSTGATPITQPGATTNSRGTLQFYAAADGYNVEYTVDGQTVIQPIDVGVTQEQFDEITFPTVGLDFEQSDDFGVKFNQLMADLGDAPAVVNVSSKNFDVIIDQESITIGRNKVINFGGNRYKLINNGSKHVMQVLPQGAPSGFIRISNFTLDGNKRGGQTRRYDTPSVDPTYGTIYEAQNNYAGFGMMVYGVKDFYMHDCEIFDTESWGVAHFLCNQFIAERVVFDQDETPALNGDGITGIATSRTILRDLIGYTNDDMTAISTSRATLDGKQVFNPANGRDIELFRVESSVPTKKGSRWPYTLAGVYLSDNFNIDKVELKGSKGFYNKHVVRIANYWANAPYNAPNSTINNVTIDDVPVTALTNNDPDYTIFECVIKSIKINGARAEKLASNVGNLSNSPLVQISDRAVVQRLNLSDFYYFNDEAPTDGVHSVVKLKNGGTGDPSLNSVRLSGELDLAGGRESDTVLIRNQGVNNVRLYIDDMRVNYGYNPGINYLMPQNITTSYANIELVNTNIMIKQPLTLSLNVSSGTYSPLICRQGQVCFLFGDIVTNSSYVDGDALFESIPEWALPYDDRAQPHAVAFRVGASDPVWLAVLKSTANCASKGGYGGTATSSTIPLNGITWDVTV